MRFIGNVEKDAQVRAIASGALPSGDAVIVNSDGTVSVISETAVSESYGTPVLFEGATSATRISSDMYDGVLVVTYVKGSTSELNAVVGIVTGETISFGTPAVVSDSTGIVYTSTTIAHTTGNVVVSFKDTGASNRGRARVASISGTTLTFGGVVQFESGVTDYIGSTYDAASDKVVISYADDSNASYGTAVVGTITGTSISFGTPVVFDSAHSLYTSCVYDPDTASVVIMYANASSQGRGVVGTVSGTSITFGGTSTYKTGVMPSYVACTYDTSSNRVVAAYRGTSGFAEAVVGAVSGTSLSFGTPVVWKSSTIIWTSVGYSSLAGKVGVAGFTTQGVSFVGAVGAADNSISFGGETIYGSPNVFFNFFASDYGSSGKLVLSYASGGSQNGNSLVLRPAYNETNLTAENFIGFAAHTYADAQSALVNSTCTVNSNQSGLTAGQAYYVQADGTLAETPANPSVLAGTAISSNSIIVKG